MTEKTITRTVYETYDGYEYETEKEAIDHEMYMHIADLEKLCDIQYNDKQRCDNCILGHFCSIIYGGTLDGNCPPFTELLKGDD